MSAFDPKRTLAALRLLPGNSAKNPIISKSKHKALSCGLSSALSWNALLHVRLSVKECNQIVGVDCPNWWACFGRHYVAQVSAPHP